jgi:alkylation response protein AidB-like acyl-CoA dehydrogenase
VLVALVRVHLSRSRWITGGFWSDYFSVACRTGKNKLTMLLIERDDNVDTKKIHTSYSKSAGTSYITFDNVKVPVENILGKEGQGLQVVVSPNPAAAIHAKCVQLSNFNRMRESAGNRF